MIRALAIAELPRLADCAAEFHRTSRFLGDFRIERFVEIWTALLANGSGAIFVDEREGEIAGTIGGIVHREIYAESLVAEEMFWFVCEGSRGAGLKLYRTFERWARANGAVHIQMVHLLDVMPEKVGKFYLRQGYEPVETRYAKRLAA